jgi:hypothetical protein
MGPSFPGILVHLGLPVVVWFVTATSQSHPFCRLLQDLGAPLQCGELASVEIWHEGRHHAA